MWKIFKLLAAFLLFVAAFSMPFIPANADLPTPGWWDPDGVGTGSDWHYRVPVTLPSTSSVNSVAKVNVDFSALMTQLGISGTFDINSIRIVRPGATLAATQEYTDTIYNDATDGTGNNRGEIKWIVQDGGTQTYYIYFDITQNGAKAANSQTKINANFEHSATGQEDPTGWNGSRVNATYEAQVRPNETVTVTDQTTVNTNGNANTGSFSYLIGARTSVDGSQADAAIVERTIAVPATNSGNITVRWKPQGWDSSQDGSTNYDYMRVEIIGASTTEIIGPTAGNYVTRPYSPNLGTVAASTTVSGYGPYNGWDTTTAGSHTAGMTVAKGAEPWWTYTSSLAAFAGQTVTVRFRTYHVSSYRSWFLIDDLEWSIVNGTLGAAEAFGVVSSTTASAAPGQTLAITATVNARPTAATTPVTANIYDNGGTLVASGILLYNDGTHGDVTAGDAIWTNNGSDGGNPTYTIPLGTLTSSGWTLRVFAKDASNSTLGAANNGLVHRNGLPNPQTEANYWNIDDFAFAVSSAIINLTKISLVISDGVSATNPKAIPGAIVQYCISIGNSGTGTANNLLATDKIPAKLTYVAESMRSGSSCGTAATIEDDNATGPDESDPVGASISGSAITITNSSLTSGSSFVLTFNATID